MTFVIVKTTNTERGDDAVMAVFGPFDSFDDAQRVCIGMQEALPSEYGDNAQYPIGYSVLRLSSAVWGGAS